MSFIYVSAVPGLFPLRAADWDLPNPQWKGRLKVVARGDKCFIKLEDKITGMRKGVVYWRRGDGTKVTEGSG